MIRVRLHSENARVPEQAHEGDAGFDLFAAEDMVIPPYKITNRHIEQKISELPTVARFHKDLEEEEEEMLSYMENEILSLNRRLISTDISLEGMEGLNEAWYAQVCPRSGNACKGLDIGAGVIDKNYRGIIKVLVINNSRYFIDIKKGDKIAQLVFHSLVSLSNEVKVAEANECVETSRGAQGFGSTDKA